MNADVLKNLSTKGKLSLAGSALAVIAVGVLLLSWAGRPSFALALTGLDPAETGEITAALDERGIGYELRSNGTAVAVDDGMLPEAQIALAEGGLAGAGSRHPGFELVTEQKLGASSFQQRVAYQQALEGQLSTVIEQIEGVSRADVQLALPEDQLFAEESQPATASVLLGADGTDLGATAVRGIAGLVSSSVKGLKTENVTITDAAGSPLWPPADGAADGGVSGTGALQAEAKYARALEAQVDAMLERTLGPGKAKVQVAADLDMSEGTREELRHGRRGIATTRKTETETFEGAGAPPGGAAGAAGNVTTYGQGAAGGGESNYERESTEEALGVDKTITKTTLAAGEVDRLSVALLVDRSVPAAQVAALQDAVGAAVGLDRARGDEIEATQFAFAKAPAAPEPSVMEGPLLGYVKYGAVGLGALALLLLAGRAIRRAERRPLAGEPVWLREIDAPRAIADLERGDDPTEVWRPAAGEVTLTRQRLESVVDEDTDRVAATVRAWMQED